MPILGDPRDIVAKTLSCSSSSDPFIVVGDERDKDLKEIIFGIDVDIIGASSLGGSFSEIKRLTSDQTRNFFVYSTEYGQASISQFGIDDELKQRRNIPPNSILNDLEIGNSDFLFYTLQDTVANSGKIISSGFGQTPMIGLVSFWDAENFFRPFDAIGSNDGLFQPFLLGRTTSDNFGNGGNSFVFDGSDDYVFISKTSCPGGTVANLFGDCALVPPCPSGTVPTFSGECGPIPFGQCPAPYSVKDLICFAAASPKISLNMNDEITIAAWLKPDKGGGAILDKSESNNVVNYRFFLGAGGADVDRKIGFWNGNNQVLASNPIPVGEWSHVAVTIEDTPVPNTLKFYINGILDSTHNISLGAINNGDLSIGKDTSGRFYDGLIDDIYLYERGLSEQEISRLFSQGVIEFEQQNTNFKSIGVHAPTNDIFVLKEQAGDTKLEQYSGSSVPISFVSTVIDSANRFIDLAVDSEKNLYTTTTGGQVEKFAHNSGSWNFERSWNGAGGERCPDGTEVNLGGDCAVVPPCPTGTAPTLSGECAPVAFFCPDGTSFNSISQCVVKQDEAGMCLAGTVPLLVGDECGPTCTGVVCFPTCPEGFKKIGLACGKDPIELEEASCPDPFFQKGLICIGESPPLLFNNLDRIEVDRKDNVYVSDEVDPYNFVRYSVDFTIVENPVELLFAAELDSNTPGVTSTTTASYYIDSIVLKKKDCDSCPNEIVNGDFTNDAAGWTSRAVAGGHDSFHGGSFLLRSFGESISDPFISQNVGNLEGNAEYTLSFDLALDLEDDASSSDGLSFKVDYIKKAPKNLLLGDQTQPVPRIQKYSSDGVFLKVALPDGIGGDVESFLQKGDFVSINDIAVGRDFYIAEGNVPFQGFSFGKRLHVFNIDSFERQEGNTVKAKYIPTAGLGSLPIQDSFTFEVFDLFDTSSPAKVDIIIDQDTAPPQIKLRDSTQTFFDTLKKIPGNPGGTCSFDSVALEFPPADSPPIPLEINRDDPLIVNLIGRSNDLQGGVVTAVDQFDPHPVLTATANNFLLGGNTVTFDTQDESGNMDSCTWKVFVEDNIPPIITVPSPITREFTGSDILVAIEPEELPQVSDNVDSNPIISNDLQASYPKGEHTIIWTVTDSSGNFAEASQILIIEDTIPPDFDMPVIPTITAIDGFSNPINYVVPVPTDEGGTAEIECTPSPGDLLPIGPTVLICAAFDDSENFNSQMEVVFVEAADSDDDGIINLVDASPVSISTVFDDTSLGGSTQGEIITAGDQIIGVIDSDVSTKGVSINALESDVGFNDDFDCEDSITGERFLGIEGDGFEDDCYLTLDNDDDGFFDEDPVGDFDGDGNPDDDGDGLIDEDPLDGLKPNITLLIDEDPFGDFDGDGNPDDDGDGLIDEDPGFDVGANTPAQIKACGATFLLTDGDFIDVTCTSASIDVLLGDVEVQFSGDSFEIFTTLKPDESLNFDAETNSISAGENTNADLEIGSNVINLKFGQKIANLLNDDIVPPSVSIDSATDGNSDPVVESGITLSNSLTIDFSSTDVDLDFFECRLNDGTFQNCSSSKTYNALPTGLNVISVRGVDTSENVGSPEILMFAILNDPDPNTVDECPTDPNKLFPGTTGCGNPEPVDIPSGNDVLSKIPISNNGITSINFEFDDVTLAGSLTIELIESGPTPPAGFALQGFGATPTYFDITTDITFTGSVQISLNYDDSGLSIAQEQALKLQHFDDTTATWIDITDNVDTSNNIISGTTSGFSLFAIMSPAVGSSGGGSGGGDKTPPKFKSLSVFGARTIQEDGTLGFGGVLTQDIKLTNSMPTVLVQKGADVSIRILIQENSGKQGIKHITMYTNTAGPKSSIYTSDTFFRYDSGKITIEDPNDIFSNENISFVQRSGDVEVVFEFTAEKTMPLSDILVRVWDNSRNSNDGRFIDAIQIIDESEQTIEFGGKIINLQTDEPLLDPEPDAVLDTETPSQLEVETVPQMDPEPLMSQNILSGWAGYSEIYVSDEKFLSHLGIEGDQIPDWFKKSNIGKWVMDGHISQQELVDTLKFLDEQGIL